MTRPRTMYARRRAPWDRAIPLAVLGALVLASCYREERPLKAPTAASDTAVHSAASRSPSGYYENRYEKNAYAVSEGKRLYRAYNCLGCHGGGGGGMGPALMDDTWLYGSDATSVFNSIANGRPNGMPAFRNRIPEDQIWMIAAYVRGMSGQIGKNVRSSRGDTVSAAPPEDRRTKEQPLDKAPDEEGKQPEDKEGQKL